MFIGKEMDKYKHAALVVLSRFVLKGSMSVEDKGKQGFDPRFGRELSKARL